MKINSSYALSAQKTYDKTEVLEVINYNSKVLNVLEPSWKEYIPRKQLRRMGKAVRIGVGAGLKLMESHPEYKEADAIIITSKNGGLEDCIKFLDQMIKYGDGALTPTNFVQSTPNAISGNLALATQNQGYNMTHVNNSFSFIDGLRDASLFIYDHKDAKILIGSVEEVSDYNYKINELEGQYKTEEINSIELLNSKTKGSICGESSVFFGISNKGDGSNIEGFDTLISEDHDEIIKFILDFIIDHNLTEEEIDTLLLGFNGDIEKDSIYKKLISTHFLTSKTLSFKDLFGEHPSVLSMGVWYADNLLNGMNPLNALVKEGNQLTNRILIFNQYNGNENSLILLSVSTPPSLTSD